MKRITVIAWIYLLSLMASAVRADEAARVVVVVSSQNPIKTLSRAQLTDIYLGRMNRFPNGNLVKPVDLSESSPTRGEFYSRYLGRSQSQIKAHWSKLLFTGRGQPPPTVSSGDAMAELVAENPNTIGYLSPDFLDERLRVVPID
ncbi:MAG: phosphate ABC transporter substrate-binding protein [Candidatus Krumholzibacteriota bacterium]|nr:phosphate ABC transporter substrate-binding protein [Candidatus Krumholzibacteriota bacterium]